MASSTSLIFYFASLVQVLCKSCASMNYGRKNRFELDTSVSSALLKLHQQLTKEGQVKCINTTDSWMAN